MNSVIDQRLNIVCGITTDRDSGHGLGFKIFDSVKSSERLLSKIKFPA